MSVAMKSQNNILLRIYAICHKVILPLYFAIVVYITQTFHVLPI